MGTRAWDEQSNGLFIFALEPIAFCDWLGYEAKGLQTGGSRSEIVRSSGKEGGSRSGIVRSSGKEGGGRHSF